MLLLGLGVRGVTDGVFAKNAGDALYAALVFCLVLLVLPRLAPWRAGGLATAVSWAVEFFQLTPVPAALSARSPLFHLVLGSAFHTSDLLWYAVGAGLPAALARAWRTARRRPSRARNRNRVSPSAATDRNRASARGRNSDPGR